MPPARPTQSSKAYGAGSEVASSEVSVSGTTYTRVRSSAITLTDGNEYKVIIKSSDGSYTTKLRDCRLVIVQDAASISATETHVHLSPYHSTSTATSGGEETPYDQRFYYNSADWDGTVTVLFEATLRSSNPRKSGNRHTLGLYLQHRGSRYRE